jgi:hypothetical protein
MALGFGELAAVRCFCASEKQAQPFDGDEWLRLLHGVDGPAEEDSAHAGRQIPGPGLGCGLGAGSEPHAGPRAASLGRALLNEGRAERMSSAVAQLGRADLAK